MLLDATTRHVEISEPAGGGEVIRATIKATAHNFKSLSIGLYTDGPRAVVRELVCNAIDAHVMSGKPDVPVEVWLPTEFCPDYRVKDVGLGMSPEFMRTKFLAFGESGGKDRDPNAIGGLGYGSKSPFSVTDQFNLVSTYEGVRSAYVVYLDGEGIPSLRCLDTAPSNEPNGVEISFPVKPEAIPAFHTTARDVLQHFDPLPIVHGFPQNEPLTPPAYMARGSNWAAHKTAGGLRILMGGVCYTAALTYSQKIATGYVDLIDFGLDLFMPIGAVPIAVSRETVRITDVTPITEAMANVEVELAEKLRTAFDHCETLWEATLALQKEAALGNNRGGLLAKHARWKGETLHTAGVSTFAKSWALLEGNRESRTRRGALKPATKRLRWDGGSFHLSPLRTNVVVVWDEPKWSKAKFDYWVQGESRLDHIWVIRDELPAELEGCDVAYASEMAEPPKKVRAGAGVRRAVRTIDQTPAAVYEYDFKVETAWMRPLCDYDDLSDCCFVTYSAEGVNKRQQNKLGLDLDQLVKLPFVASGRVLVCHVSHAKRFGKLMPTLVQKAEAGFDAVMAKRGKEIANLLYVYRFAKQHRVLAKCAVGTEKFNPRTNYGKIIAGIRRHAPQLREEQELLMRLPRVDGVAPKGFDPHALLEAAHDSEPLARRFIGLASGDITDAKIISKLL